MTNNRFGFRSSTAIASVAAMAPATDSGADTPAVYSKEEYISLDIGNYRERFANETNHLTDRALFDLVMGTDDDMDDDAWRKLLSSHNIAAANIDGEALAANAHALAAKADGAGVTAAIEAVMKAKEDWQGGPFKVLFALQSAYEPEELDEFAVPDSETGNNPDYYKVPKTDGNNKTRMVETSFYVQFADATASGQAILARIEYCERAGDPKAIKEDIPADILEMSPHQRETHLNFLKGRRNTIRQAYKNAMKVYFQIGKVSAYPGISVDLIYAHGKSPSDVEAGKCELPEVENTTKPVQVWVTPEEGKPIAKWEALSVAAFMKLNPSKGLEKGGTFQALLESGIVKKKKAGAGATSDKPEGLVIKTIETGVSVLAEFHRWLDETATARDKVEYGKLLKVGNAKDNDEFISALVETRNMLNDLAREVNADAKYVKLQQAGSDMVSDTTKTATK
jgi:hypothetical protein